jgi:hypothetical protein
MTDRMMRLLARAPKSWKPLQSGYDVGGYFTIYFELTNPMNTKKVYWP